MMEMSVLNGYPDSSRRGGPASSAAVGGVNITPRKGGATTVDTSLTYGGSPSSGQRSSLSASTSSDLKYNDAGPHREMAIDCPANFIGVKKEPPRLPRPLSSVIQSTPTGSPKGSFGSLTVQAGKGRPGGTAAAGQPMPAPRPRSSANGGTDSVSKVAGAFERDERDRSERIRRQQEELQKRREMEDRISQENEMLRASLRGSKKMQGLEEKRARARAAEARNNGAGTAGFDNPNYDDADERTLVAKSRVGMVQSLPMTTTSHVAVGENEILGLMTIEDIMTSIQQAKKYLNNAEDQSDLSRVSQFVTSERFQRMLRLHNKLVDVSLNTAPPPAPSSSLSASVSASDLCQSVAETLGNTGGGNKYARELIVLLSDAHIRNLLFAYDRSADCKLLPVKSSADEDEREYLYERASQYGDENIKIVRLQKTADPLGATVRNEGESVIIGRIVKGGVAERSGLLHEGDEILEINGVDMRGKSINDVCDLMSSLTGILTFLINPGPEHGPVIRNDIIMHVRALFTYDPEDDPYIPCRELGISFLKGDILHVINQEDLNWWQAYRDGEDDQTLAGLIPSKSFQEQRETVRLMLMGEQKEKAKKKHRCHCGHRLKRKKGKLYGTDGEEIDAEEILTYEEVSLYYPQPNRKRPIVLIGPPSVGRQELRQRIMESNHERFASAIPHTSRPMRMNEMNGRDYHFVERAEFEADIAEGRFVEYGEYEKHLFGTSMESIRQVVNAGKICILNFHPQSMRILKASDLKPYFIFIAPPNIEKLKQLRQKQGVKFTDDELKSIIEKAREMEDNFGHYFDMIIVNQDFDRAYDELLAEINRLEIQPQWVPIRWVT
jgi:MAGUK p55 subfamily protein 5